MPCLPDSITSFPLKIEGVQSYNDIRSNLLVENINLIFKWGSSFSYPNIQVLNASSSEITHNSFNSTNLVYNFLNYKLINAQITKANFSDWLSLSVSPSNNTHDIVLTFLHEPINGSDYDKSPQIILLVNPIIINTTKDNDFLKSLAGDDISRKSISTETLFENNSANNYAYYTTCISNNPNSFNDSFGDFQNMLVVVNTGGTLFTLNTTLTKIISKITTAITNYTPVFYYLKILPYSMSNIDTIIKKIKLSKGYIIREDIYQETTDAYKCVPINPENDIDGTQIKNDKNATSLKSILDERENEKKQYNNAFIKRMGLLSEVVTGILSVALGIIVICIIGYLIWTYKLRDEPLIFSNYSKYFSLIFTAITFSIIGIVIGYLIGFGLWKAPEVSKNSVAPSG
jgi:hypothetical protein